MNKKWRVKTQATVYRIYEVEAENQKEAEDKSVDSDMLETEDVWEETLSIVLLDAADG